jgi:hypothetical protein
MTVAVVALALGCTGRGADAAPASRCVMTGSIGGPNPAYEGDNVSAAVSVSSSHGFCDAGSVQITGGSWTLCSENLHFGSGGCSITFQAFRGLSAVTATLSTGQSLRLGTFTVLSRTPTTHASSPRPTRTVTVVPPASRSAAASSSAAVASASRASVAAASASRAAARHTRTSTVTSTAFPSDTAAPSSEAAAPSDTPPSDTASASGFAVNVRTNPSGGSSIPFGPLLLALLVLAGVVVAAARLVYTHAHEELQA